MNCVLADAKPDDAPSGASSQPKRDRISLRFRGRKTKTQQFVIAGEAQTEHPQAEHKASPSGTIVLRFSGRKTICCPKRSQRKAPARAMYCVLADAKPEMTPQAEPASPSGTPSLRFGGRKKQPNAVTTSVTLWASPSGTRGPSGTTVRHSSNVSK